MTNAQTEPRPLRPGEWVRYITPTNDRYGAIIAGVQGRVEAVETYEDNHGTRTWFYVRWIDSEGKPDKETTRCHRAELEGM